MFDGSLTMSTSTPTRSIARRVLARRSAYSSRVNLRLGELMKRWFLVWSAFENGSCPGRRRALPGKGGDRGILRAGACQVAKGDRRRQAAATDLAGHDRPQFREVCIGGNRPRLDGMVQFAQPSRLPQAVGDIGFGAQYRGRVDLVLVLRVGAHGRNMLAGRQ